MKKMITKVLTSCVAVFLGFLLIIPPAFAVEGSLEKVGFVDLRRAFYEYEKSKTLDKELTDITAQRTEERAAMVEKITKLRDESELLNDDAKAKKQQEIDAEITRLNEFDRDIRQEILTKKNDMFREIIDDIRKVVEVIGEKEGYDAILDSRDIMYAKEGFDLTDQVLKELNK